MPQIPRGDEHLNCPLWKKSMDQVCHKCPLWVQLRGRNPQTGEDVDSWQCSLASLPMLLIENAHQTRQAGAETEKLRNELALTSANTMAAAEAYQMIIHQREQGVPKLIEGH